MILLLIIVFGAFISMKPGKAVCLLAGITIVIILLFGLYNSLSADMRYPALDAYIIRIQEKIVAFRHGDLDTVTTGRSAIFSEYLSYIFIQSPISMMFGGNSLNIIGGYVPHNTFLSIILQVGLVGALAFFGWIIYNFVISFKKTLNTESNFVILLKVISIFFGFTVSLYQGNVWAIWMYVLVLL